MANATVTIDGYTQYNQKDNVATSSSGWHSWQTSQSGGYASTWDAVACKFRINSYSGTHSNIITKANITLQHRKGGSGTFYFYIVSTDPRGVSLNSFKTNNSAFGYAGWSGSSSWKTDTYTVNCSETITAGTTYYLVVCGSGTIAEINTSGFGLSFEYTAINSISTPSAPTITNHFNNTFSASCDAVGDPGNNPVTTTLEYKLGSSGSWTFTSGVRSISRRDHNAAPTADSITVFARTKAVPTYGDTLYSSEVNATLKNYVAPSQPTEKPSVSKTKSRFTVKEPWTVSWSKTTQQARKKNNSSPVAGYRIVMLVKRKGIDPWTSEPFKVKSTNSQGWSYLGQNPDNTDNGDEWYTVDTSDLDSMTEITIDPMVQGFKPGDMVKVGIRPYTLYGAKYPPHEDSLNCDYKLFSSEQSINGNGEAYTFTDEITVQNAGVVRVKTGTDKSSFKEGIVWVKINNTGNKTTDWVEADVVKVKTAKGWKESE